MVRHTSSNLMNESDIDFLQNKAKEDRYALVESENVKLTNTNCDLNAENQVLKVENETLRKERIYFIDLVNHLQKRIHFMSMFIKDQLSDDQSQDEEEKPIIKQEPIGTKRSIKSNLGDQKVQLQNINYELQVQYEAPIEATNCFKFVINDNQDSLDLSYPNLKNMPNPLKIGSLHYEQLVREMYGLETEKIEKFKKSWLEIKPMDPVLIEEFPFTAAYSSTIDDIRDLANQIPSYYMMSLPLYLSFSKLNYILFKKQKDAGQLGNHIKAVEQLGNSILMCVSKIQEIMDELGMTAEMVTMAECEKYVTNV